MSAIGNRLNEAISKIANGDLENALIQVSIAIDASGKKKRPSKGVGVRYKEFIRDHESLIYFMAIGIKGDSKPIVVFPGENGNNYDIAHAYYKSVRNGLLHDGEISENLEVVNGNVLTYKDGKISISKIILWALVLAVVCDPINANETFGREYTVTFTNGGEIELHNMWGKMREVYNSIGHGNV